MPDDAARRAAPARTGLVRPVLRAWTTRRPYRATMVDGAEWASCTVHRLSRLLSWWRHYRAMGFR